MAASVPDCISINWGEPLNRGQIGDMSAQPDMLERWRFIHSGGTWQNNCLYLNSILIIDQKRTPLKAPLNSQDFFSKQTSPTVGLPPKISKIYQISFGQLFTCFFSSHFFVEKRHHCMVIYRPTYISGPARNGSIPPITLTDSHGSHRSFVYTHVVECPIW